MRCARACLLLVAFYAGITAWYAGLPCWFAAALGATIGTLAELVTQGYESTIRDDNHSATSGKGA